MTSNPSEAKVGTEPSASRRRSSSADDTSPWRSRGYLPHFERPGLAQALTFRLYDSVPAHVIEGWRTELARTEQPADLQATLRKRLVRFEDAGHGACWLRDERIAALVEGVLLNFDGKRYRLIAWCIMANHAHALIETIGEWTLDRVVHGWKSYTSHAANRVLGRTGQFWAREYHDRFVRDDDHLAACIRYIEHNPVAAGLVLEAESWRWSSARRRV